MYPKKVRATEISSFGFRWTSAEISRQQLHIVAATANVAVNDDNDAYLKSTMDIFDEEDLLAIANDGGASLNTEESSNVSSVGSVLDTKDLKEKASEAALDIGKTDGIGNLHTSYVNVNDDAEDDSDDKGFLEDWFVEIKKCEDEEDRVEASAQKSDGECSAEDKINETERDNADVDAVELPTQVEHVAINLCSADDERQNEHDSIEIQMGSSALDWISKFNSKRKRALNTTKLNNNATVEIQRGYQLSGDDNELPPSLVMGLEKNDNKSKTAGSKCSAILGTADMNTLSQTQQFKGDIVTSPFSFQRKPNAIVDCLARYNLQKKCYILEVVEMTVSNLKQHLRLETAESVAKSSDTTKALKTQFVDPRLLAKRADAQVKKLKQGKRKRVSDHSNPRTKSKTEASKG